MALGIVATLQWFFCFLYDWQDGWRAEATLSFFSSIPLFAERNNESLSALLNFFCILNMSGFGTFASC
jgi:hypothetical protein